MYNNSKLVRLNMQKKIINIIFANIIYLVVVAGTNFLLPKFTSIETYAAIKVYTLYLTTYASILTLGYIQGMYLEFGGKDIEKTKPGEIGTSILSFFFFILPISIIISVIGLVTGNIILTFLGIGILSNNIQHYYQMLYQATGDFKSYGVALNASRVILFLVYMVLVYVIKTDNKVLYVGVVPFIDVIIAVYLTVKLNKRIPLLNNARFCLGDLKSNIKDGFVLMLGDFVTKFFSSIDRWFVNILMNTFNFAMYSFAISMENLVNTLMTPITVSMYNFFCKKPKTDDICKMKNSALIYSFIIIAGAYPAKWILENYMVRYIASTSVIFPLFAAQGLSAVIKGFYVNKYKADSTQKKYLFQMIVMLVLSIILNGIFYFVFRSIAAIAVATLITNAVWLIVCEFENPDLRYKPQALIFMIVLLAVYLITGYTVNSILGCFIYCSLGLVLGMTLMRKSFMLIVCSVAQIATSKFKRE